MLYRKTESGNQILPLHGAKAGLHGMEKQTDTMAEQRQKQREQANFLNIPLQELRLKSMYRSIKTVETLKSIWMMKK